MTTGMLHIKIQLLEYQMLWDGGFQSDKQTHTSRDHVDYCGSRNVRVFQIKEIFCPPAAAAMSDASVAAHSCWGL